MLDLCLAITHHLLIFSLFGILAAELVLVRRGMDNAAVRRVASIDILYGIFAALIVVIGLLRAVSAAKGWIYYSHNTFFWAKIGTFLLITLISILPTVTFIRSRRAKTPPSDAQIGRIRRLLWAEVVLFAPVLAFAAAMARGYGE